MDAKKIVETMKAVLKKTKSKKKKNVNSEIVSSNDEEISELMNKNWKMKTPPVARKDFGDKNSKLDDKTNKPKQKINAFEKLMSKKLNNPTTSQKSAPSTPETNSEKQKTTKKTTRTKNKTNLIINSQSADESNSDDSSPCGLKISLKRRIKASEESTDNSSKKRKVKENKIQLDSNENNVEEVQRPRRSCANKIDYSLLAGSPEKTKTDKEIKKSESPTVIETKENVKLAPLFMTARKNKKISNESVLKEENSLEVTEKHEISMNDKLQEITFKDDIRQESGRPRRSCAGKTDYSIFNKSPNKVSPGKRPLRPRSGTENISDDDNKIIDVATSVSSARKLHRKQNNDTTNSLEIPTSPIKTKTQTSPQKAKIRSSPQNTNTLETLQSTRPKRSCSNRINYAQLFDSPEKQSPDKKSSQKKLTKTNNDEDIIFIDENLPKKKTNVKLAPLFVKKVPKPAIDPAILEARRNFLMSELPAHLRAPIHKLRQLEDNILLNDMVAFPKVTHVTQLKNGWEKDLYSFEENGIENENVKNETMKEILKNGTARKTVENETFKTMENGTIKRSNANNLKIKQFLTENHDDLAMTTNFTLKYGTLTGSNLKDLDNSASNNSQDPKNPQTNHQLEPIQDIIEAVRKVKDSCKNFPVNRCFKQILNKLKSAKDNDDAYENSGISFKNSSFVEIFKPICFKEILIGSEPVKQLQEFLNSWNNGKYENYESDDSSSRQSSKGINNCAVLSGKNGTGKTSSVYALANDLNYEVIEINAGTRRSGKKILQDLLEATQSHRVEKNLMDEEVGSNCYSQNDSVDKKTIILIEDAELTFENDDGFISSIQQLINISKRPVILTTNDSNCLHLQKYIQFNEIIYDSPKSNLTKYLSLICIATANYKIDEDELTELYALNKCDLRKTINEIEFFVRSECASVNRGSLMGLFSNVEKDYGKFRQRSSSNNNEMTFKSQKDLATLLRQSSIVSECAVMIACKTQQQQRVLNRNEMSYQQEYLMNEIADFVGQTSLPKTKYQNEQQRVISSSISDEICSSTTSNRAKNVDYSPFLRHICRSEKIRDISRRTNRSHYLRHHLSSTLNVDKYFLEQCLIFQEDT